MNVKNTRAMVRKIFTVGDAAAYLGIGEDELRELVDTSRIPYAVFHDHILFLEDDLEEYYQYLKSKTFHQTIEQEPPPLTRQPVPEATIAALKSKPAQSKIGYVYIILYQGYYKIGKAMNVNKRLTELGTQMPEMYEVIHTIEAVNPLQAEGILKKYFASKRKRGEWFALNDADIQWIKSLKRVTSDLLRDDALSAV